MRVLNALRSRTTAVVAGATVVVLASAGGGAIAAGLITSGDIKDGTIRSVDIHDGGVHPNDLSKYVRAQVNRTQHVSGLHRSFRATNSSVGLTPDGVSFGPYDNGGSDGGSLQFRGLNGMHLRDVENLVYYMRYTTTGDSSGVGVPYLRIFLNNDHHDAIFSPNTQSPDPDIAEGPFHEWVATSGSWRYDDDAGNGSDETFQQLVADHGNARISGVYISTGFSAGTDLTALLRWMQVNGKTYTFSG